jgi:4-amino-4-deoxy-L-arabinose transferase-like glycosyltransferase
MLETGQKQAGRDWQSIAVAAVAAAIIWTAFEPAAFYGVDAGCYARVAQELLTRPWTQWANITMGGDPFFEHPPLAHWVLATSFHLFGTTAAVAWNVARFMMSCVLLMQWLVARRLEHTRAGALGVLAVLTLADFHYEVTNTMLDLPLMLCMTAAIAVSVVPAPSSLRNRLGMLVGFSLACAAGFLVKGPPILGVMAVLGLQVARRRLRLVDAVVMAVGGVVAIVLAALAFDAWRAAIGLDSFWKHYLEIQLFPSLVKGRHNPQSNPFYYLYTLKDFYIPLLIAVPLAIYAVVAQRRRSELTLLGLFWVVVIVGGFSLPRQKYGWYITPLIPGAGWFMGASLNAVIPVVADRWMTRVLGALAVTWTVASMVYTRPIKGSREVIQNIRTIPAPPPGPDLLVANCSELNSWRASHLFIFYWHAGHIDCQEQPGANARVYTFDGFTLKPRPPAE